MRTLGTLNLHTMLSQKNFLTYSEVMVAAGLASIHLIKYSIAMTANLLPHCDGGRGPTKSMPYLCNGQVGEMG